MENRIVNEWNVGVILTALLWQSLNVVRSVVVYLFWHVAIPLLKMSAQFVTQVAYFVTHVVTQNGITLIARIVVHYAVTVLPLIGVGLLVTSYPRLSRNVQK